LYVLVISFGDQWFISSTGVTARVNINKMFKFTVLPQKEANRSVCFPWPQLEAVLSIPNFTVSVKRQFFDKELIIHTEELTLMPNHKIYIMSTLEKKISSRVQ
jgi:hypothetical protein